MNRDASTKQLASRIDPRYIRRPVWPRSLLRGSAWGLTLAGLAWSLGVTFQGGEHLYEPGPLTTGHAVAAASLPPGQKCALCHSKWNRVEDSRCTACHRRAMHHPNMSFDPRCADCHAEHRPRASLLDLPDRSCVPCHEDLKTQDGKASFHPRIHSFASDHPEFRVKREGHRDPGTLRFNHQLHLKTDLKKKDVYLASIGFSGSAAARPDGLLCVDCHQSGETGRLMTSISYARTCQPCHSMEFDGRILASPTRGEEAPHGQPIVIHRFLLGRYQEYLDLHPEALQASPTGSGLSLSGAVALTTTATEWVKTQTESAERRISKQCSYCHQTTVAPALSDPPTPFFAGRFEAKPPGLVKRWLPHARFSHAAHRSFRCDACHAGTRGSSDAADVILPGIQTCKACHVPGVGAGSQCIECHTYHDSAGASAYVGSLPVPDTPRADTPK